MDAQGVGIFSPGCKVREQSTARIRIAVISWGIAGSGYASSAYSLGGVGGAV